MVTLKEVGSIPVLYPFILLTLLSIFFFVPISFGGLGVRIDDVLILLCAPLLILRARYIVVQSYLIPILLFLASVFFSIIYGYLFLDVGFSGGDINEYFRYLKIFIFALLLGYLPVHQLSLIAGKIFYYGSFYLIVVGYLQYFDPVGVGRYISLFYTSESQLSTAIDHEVRRVTGTGSGPNDGAIIVAYFILFNFFAFLFTDRKKYLILFLLLFTVLFFTQSRTVLIGTASSLLVVFFSLKGYWSKKIFLLLIVSTLVVVLFPLFSYIFIGFQSLLDGKNNSVLVRIGNAEQAFMLFKDSPLLGYGIAKSFLIDRMDSEYLSFISRFGIIGLTLGVLMVVFPLFSKNTVDKLNNTKLNVFYYTLIGSSIVGIFVMITNNFITGYQSFLPFVLLAVLSARLIRYLRGLC